MNIKSRILSVVLSLAMVFSMLPTTAFASLGSITGGTSYVPELNGTGGQADTVANGVKQHGYQVSIWVALDEEGDGTYDWDNAEKLNDTDMQLRMMDLNGYTPTYWVEGGVFEQTTLGYGFDDLVSYSVLDDYTFTQWPSTPSNGWDSANALQSSMKTTLENALELDPDNEDIADWLSRIDNIQTGSSTYKSLQSFGFAMAYTDNE